MEYKVDHFVQDFMRRTLKNERVINSLAHQLNTKEHDVVFEVTQQINSLLGILVSPEAKFCGFDNWGAIKNKRSYKMVESFFAMIANEGRLVDTYEKDKRSEIKVKEILRRMKNALSHSGTGGLRFLPVSENQQISDIFFFDGGTSFKLEYLLNNHENIFCLKMHVDELLEFMRLVRNLYIDIENMTKPEIQVAAYKNEIDAYESFLQKMHNKAEVNIELRSFAKE